ncbi:MAG: RNA-binding protein [Nitrospinota bacterium]|nr:RNA-binding protein [Nitrospinota bacterium]MDH5677915.1 RNA-binding protein [Nitrospinota bacterium]MDH5756184.1 RNA-binding protein [Nitrospinota bacterium]
MKIFVGNLPFSVTEEKLNSMFQEFGEIESCKLITDRESGRSRGFGFIEMSNADADAAIKALNGTNMEDRVIKVNQSEPKKEKSGGRRRSW